MYQTTPVPHVQCLYNSLVNVNEFILVDGEPVVAVHECIVFMQVERNK